MTKAQDRIKNKLKLLVGIDKYQQFMGDYTGGIISFSDLVRKYEVTISPATLAKWAHKLGYQDQRVRQQKRTHYKIQSRINERRENMKKILKILGA